MKKLLSILPFFILTTATYITLSEKWIAPDINIWQAKMMGDNKYFSVLTIFILALPPMLMLLILKFLSAKRKHKP